MLRRIASSKKASFAFIALIYNLLCVIAANWIDPAVVQSALMFGNGIVGVCIGGQSVADSIGQGKKAE